MSASLPHRGHTAVSPLAGAGSSKLLMSSPVQATIPRGAKTSRQERQPHSELDSISARLFVVCRWAVARLAGKGWIPQKAKPEPISCRQSVQTFDQPHLRTGDQDQRIQSWGTSR